MTLRFPQDSIQQSAPAAPPPEAEPEAQPVATKAAGKVAPRPKPRPAQPAVTTTDSVSTDTLSNDSIVETAATAPADSSGHAMAFPWLKADSTIYDEEFFNSFFHTDSLSRFTTSRARGGVSGDPLPFSFRSDDVMTGILLACFILAVVAFSRTRSYMLRQASTFFRIPRSENVFEVGETTGELRFLIFMSLLTCLLLAIFSFIYVHDVVADTFALESPYMLVLIFFGCIVGYMVLKVLLYSLINIIFFDTKKNTQWLKAVMLLTSAEGVALFPLVMLQSYFDLSVETSLIYMAIVLTIVKILTFYKCWIIFFRQNAAPLQIFLYFCTLEIVPLLSLVGMMATIVDYLKINF